MNHDVATTLFVEIGQPSSVKKWQMQCVLLKMWITLHSILEATASNHFDESFAQVKN